MSHDSDVYTSTAKVPADKGIKNRLGDLSDDIECLLGNLDELTVALSPVTVPLPEVPRGADQDKESASEVSMTLYALDVKLKSGINRVQHLLKCLDL